MKMKNKSFYLRTLGCRLNQAESQELAEKLMTAGWRPAEKPEEADLIVVNTCVVTHKAAKETRQTIRQMRRANSHAKLAAAGCWVDMEKKRQETFVSDLRQIIDYRIENRRKWTGLMGDLEKLVMPKKIRAGVVTDGNPRKYIKIQTGCSYACTFCLTRLVRGKPESVPASKIVREVKKAVSQGKREIVLTGVNIAEYNDKGKTWIDLVEEILKDTKVELLRVGSVNPVLARGDAAGADWGKRLLRLYRGAGKGRLARHLHISLQSASNRILKLMGRRYSAEDGEKLIKTLERIPGMNITADIIVGFPGETEKDFQKTYDFCRRMKFGKIHVFRFSSRPGTLAAAKEKDWGAVDEKTKKERENKLLELNKEMKKKPAGDERVVSYPDGTKMTDNFLRIGKRSLSSMAELST